MNKSPKNDLPVAPFLGMQPARCPFCASINTHKESDFGTTLAYAQYYCNDCRTMFEWIKWEDRQHDQRLPGFVAGR